VRELRPPGVVLGGLPSVHGSFASGSIDSLVLPHRSGHRSPRGGGRHSRRKDSAIRRALSEKIQGSVIELREHIPPGYVKLNSRVTFCVNGAVTLSRVLVHWDAFSVPGLELSLATPWGVALLGARAGHEAPVHWRGGFAETLRVEAVEGPLDSQQARGTDWPVMSSRP
jgi:transcription elongation GreA/GreB family factor